ncbi:MAG: bifunctional oligoribonuclease/PAP phosphatase NrnA [Treponema sp.]|nr:bifunctional oligoribonuclease/PAP phosphatase NrnA [Treponema sp.]
MNTIIPQNYINEFSDFISSHDFFYVIGHKEPDGDCIASCLGVSEILKTFNKEHLLLSAGPFKRNEIIQYESLFTNEMPFQNDDERKKTGLIIVDCSEIQRLGEIEGDFKELDTFVIDHHKTSELPDNMKGYVNPAAPACAYLVQLFYEELIGPLKSELAKIIFFGISTDTGFFRFLSTSPESADILSACSRLVTYGADPRSIYTEINSGKPYSTRKLLGILLNKAERYLDNRLVITYETMEDTKKYGIDGRDSDALYQLLLSAKDVEAVVFLRQDTPTTCTGGFRSQDKVDVSLVASKFGGGGHKNASGMSTEGKLETLIPQIVKEFARIM